LRRYARELRSLAAGLVLPLIVLVYFKWTLAPPGDLVTLAAKQSLWAKIADPGRYLTIAGELARRTPFHVCMLPIYALCVGWGGRTTGVAQAALAFLLLSAAYLAAYVATPYDLSWHLYTSVDRLLVQIWPLFVLVFFLAVRTPEEARRAVESGEGERFDASIRS